MPLSVDQFGKAIVAAGLFSAPELQSLWTALSAAERPKDAAAFAELLVRREQLTPFQATELLAGGKTPLVLGDYVLLARIGAGGMGQVFQARHRHMDRLVAIKLLPPATMQDPAAVQRFQREVKAAAKLSHPNIVQAHDAGLQRGVWYLVMEYVAGRDLAALVREHGPFTIRDAVDCIRQAALGLAYAHGKGVIHRDIKPANLLLDADGRLKILDMGLARFDTSADAADHQLTNSGIVMGTVDYMAPEQAADTHAADARSDLYSLGCTLFRLLTNANVFEGETLVKKVLAHTNAPIPSLCKRREDVPVGIDRIFQKLVAKKPEDRYQSASTLAADLEKVLAAPKKDSTITEPDSKLTTFFESTGAKGKAVATKPAPLTAVPEETLAHVGREVGTDPKTESLAPAVVPTTEKSEARTKKKLPSAVKWIVTTGLAAAFLLGVWLSTKRPEVEKVGPKSVNQTAVPTIESPAQEALTSDDWEWSAPQPLSLTANNEFARQPSLSQDELELYFISQGTGNSDLWYSHRATTNSPWEKAVVLGEPISSRFYDAHPTLSASGLRLGWTRHGQNTDPTQWIVTRKTRSEPWSTPQQIEHGMLGYCQIFFLSEDGNQLYLSSNRGGGQGGQDIYFLRRDSEIAGWRTSDDGLQALNGPHDDIPCWVSEDRCTMILRSVLSEGGQPRLCRSTRSRVDLSWTRPVDLAEANGFPGNASYAWISADGRSLYTNFDEKIWYSRRVPKTKKPPPRVVASPPPFTVELVKTIPGYDTDFVLDGKLLRVGRYLYDPETGEEQRDLLPASETRELAAGPAVSRDGKQLTWITKDGELSVWDTAVNRVVWKENIGKRGYRLQLSPDNTRLATWADGRVAVWDFATGAKASSFPHHVPPQVNAFRFSPSGRWLAIGSIDGWNLWDSATGKDTAFRFNGWAMGVTFSRDDKQVIAARQIQDQKAPTEWVFYDLPEKIERRRLRLEGNAVLGFFGSQNEVLYSRGTGFRRLDPAYDGVVEVTPTTSERNFTIGPIFSADDRYLVIARHDPSAEQTQLFRRLPISAADRAAAEALGQYADLKVVVAGAKKDIHAGEQLPAEPFALVEIFFGARDLPAGFLKDVFLPAIKPLQAVQEIWDLQNKLRYDGISADPIRQLTQAPCGRSLVRVPFTINPTPATLQAFHEFRRLRSANIYEGGDPDLQLLLESVNYLWIHHRKSGDRGLERRQIQSIAPRLKHLALEGGFEILDRDFAEMLADLPCLERLSLVFKPSDDEIKALSELQRSNSLKQVWLNQPTPEATVLKVSNALPRCQIEWGRRILGPKTEESSPEPVK